MSNEVQDTQAADARKSRRKKGLTILASHPLTEDRLKRMSEEDRPASGPPLLSAEEWTALKVICAK